LVCAQQLVDIVPRPVLRRFGRSRAVPESCILIAIYEQLNFEQIASAIGVDVGQIANHANQLEAAALWYRLDRRRPARTAPFQLRKKLDRVAKSGRRLLKSLGADNPGVAYDGPGDPEILRALVLAGEPSPDPVIGATRRAGRLAEIIDGVAAAAELERRANKAAIEVADIGKLTVREGNPGDDAVNDWIAAMMGLYRTITGREPATSVGAFGQPNEGVAAGPLIRFLEAAGKPLGIEFSEGAWRSRVRTILEGASRQK
jgi:hypothetical protein